VFPLPLHINGLPLSAGSDISLQAIIRLFMYGNVVEPVQQNPLVKRFNLGNVVEVNLGSPDTADADG